METADETLGPTDEAREGRTGRPANLCWPGSRGRRVPLAGPQVLVGRHPGNDVVLHDGGVSRRHFRLVRVGDAHVLEDCGARNGTFVDGVRVTGPVWLRGRRRIGAGDVTLLYEPEEPGLGTGVPAERRAAGPAGTPELAAGPPVGENRRTAGTGLPARRGRELSCWWGFSGGGFVFGWELRPVGDDAADGWTT